MTTVGAHVRAALSRRPGGTVVTRKPWYGVGFLSTHDVLRSSAVALTGCSSDWQSAAFGTQKSLVQIQSPRLSHRSGSPLASRVDDSRDGLRPAHGAAPAALSYLSRACRSGTVAAFLAFVMLGSAGGSFAEEASPAVTSATPDATPSARSAERQTRSQPAIDVSGLRQRLDDLETDQRAAVDGLRAEVARLHATVEDLESLAPSLAYVQPVEPEPPPGWQAFDTWLLAGGTLVLGLLAGGAWQRYRSRRERMLRF